MSRQPPGMARLAGTGLGGYELGGELLLERGPLVLAQAADPAVLRDTQAAHHLLRPDLAHARYGLQQRRQLHLPDRVVRGAPLEGVGHGHGSPLDAVLDLGTLLAGTASLLQGGGAGFGSQDG